METFKINNQLAALSSHKNISATFGNNDLAQEPDDSNLWYLSIYLF